MRGFNQAVLLGSVSSIEPFSSKNGKRVCNLILETRTIQHRNGSDEEIVAFVPMVAFGRVAENIEQYVKRGDLLHVVCRLESKEYMAQNGTPRRALSAIVESVHFLADRRGKEAAQ
jgi:single-strand DNA-binding protein